MESNDSNRFIQITVVITYLLMIVANALANILPINGQTTGEISDKYGNLFAPAGYTFSIWGFIYILLAGYVLYQLGFFRKGKTDSSLLNKIGVYFSISSIANTLWILAWHYEKLGISVIIMIMILYCLIQINRLTSKAKLSRREKVFVRLPFSVYFGWITVATIANITAYLVSINWDGFGITDVVWTIVILLIGLIIGIKTTLKNNDLAYGLVIIWAYVGILIKHISESGFNWQHPLIIITLIICLAVLIGVLGVMKKR